MLLLNNDQPVIGILFEIHTGMVTIHKRDFSHWDTKWIALRDPFNPSNQIRSQGEGSFVFFGFSLSLLFQSKGFCFKLESSNIQSIAGTRLASLR